MCGCSSVVTELAQIFGNVRASLQHTSVKLMWACVAPAGDASPPTGPLCSLENNMKYLIATIAVSVGQFLTTGTASAQHHGGHHSYGGHYSHGSHHNHGGYYSGGYAPLSVGICSPGAPSYGSNYSQGYDPGAYSSPSYYAPNVGFSASIYSGGNYGGGYYGGSGPGHAHRRHHHQHHH
jgi:hypothetical protein